MRHNTLTVGTTAVKVPVGKGDAPVIINNGTTTIYFGDTDDVTSANGIPLGQSVGYEFSRTLEEAEWNELWVISSASDGQVRYGTVG